MASSWLRSLLIRTELNWWRKDRGSGLHRCKRRSRNLTKTREWLSVTMYSLVTWINAVHCIACFVWLLIIVNHGLLICSALPWSRYGVMSLLVSLTGFTTYCYKVTRLITRQEAFANKTDSVWWVSGQSAMYDSSSFDYCEVSPVYFLKQFSYNGDSSFVELEPILVSKLISDATKYIYIYKSIL